MKTGRITHHLTAISVGLLLAASTGTALAQQQAVSADQKVVKARRVASSSTPPKVSIEVKNAPIRQALTEMFTRAKVDYVLDQTVQGAVVSARITNQPFESALRILLDSSTQPLSFTRDGDTYIIAGRPAARTITIQGDREEAAEFNERQATATAAERAALAERAVLAERAALDNSYTQGGLQFGNAPGLYTGVSGFYSGSPAVRFGNTGGLQFGAPIGPVGGIVGGFGGYFNGFFGPGYGFGFTPGYGGFFPGYSGGFGNSVIYSY